MPHHTVTLQKKISINLAYLYKLDKNLLNCFLYSYERNNLLSNLTGVLEKQPATITKENLLKALLMGERNDDPLKYKHNKKYSNMLNTPLLKQEGGTINLYYN